MFYPYIGVYVLHEGDKERDAEGQLSFSVDGALKRTPSRLFSAPRYVSGHMATHWNISTQCTISPRFLPGNTRCNAVKSVPTPRQKYKVISSKPAKGEEGRRGFSLIPWRRSWWDFSAAAVQICWICSATRKAERKADVLYLQMAEVNLWSVSEVCGGGRLGGGMTIGLRECSM